MSNFLTVAAAESAAPAKVAAPAPQTTQRTEVPAGTAANAPQPQQANPWLSMLPFILIFVVMIFFMNRSQKKTMQKRQEMMDKITKGTKVLLTSGIYGTVAEVREDAMMVEIADNVRIRVNKSGIAEIEAPEAAGKTGSK